MCRDGPILGLGPGTMVLCMLVKQLQRLLASKYFIGIGSYQSRSHSVTETPRHQGNYSTVSPKNEGVVTFLE